MVQPAHKGQTLQKQKLTDLLEMGVDNDPVPVHCNGYDGQGGHEHSYAGEGLNQSVKINTQNRFYFLQNVLSDQIGNVCNTKTEQKNYLQLKLKKHFKYQISLQFHAGYDVAQQPHRIGSLIIFGSGWEILYFAQDHLSSFHHNVFFSRLCKIISEANFSDNKGHFTYICKFVVPRIVPWNNCCHDLHNFSVDQLSIQLN